MLGKGRLDNVEIQSLDSLHSRLVALLSLPDRKSLFNSDADPLHCTISQCPCCLLAGGQK